MNRIGQRAVLKCLYQYGMSSKAIEQVLNHVHGDADMFQAQYDALVKSISTDLVPFDVLIWMHSYCSDQELEDERYILLSVTEAEYEYLSNKADNSSKSLNDFLLYQGLVAP